MTLIGAHPKDIIMMEAGDNQESAIDVDSYCRLPSLCKMIAEPEAHPDLAMAMAPFTIAQQEKRKMIKESLQSQSGQLLLPPLSMLFTLQQPISKVRQNPVAKSPSTAPRPRHRSSASVSSSQTVVKKPTFSKKRSLRQDAGGVVVSPPRLAKLYAVADYKISESHFYTSAAPAGFITVYSYFIGNHCIIIDAQTSMVSLTNICMALGRPEVISKIMQSKEFAPYLETITSSQSAMEYIWAPLSIAREISRRIAWKLRFDLVPIFGFHFPTQCLAPNDPHFEDLSLLTSTRRANSRLAESSFARSTTASTKGSAQYRVSTDSFNGRPGNVPLQGSQIRHRSETMSTNTSSSSISLLSTPPTSTSVSPVPSRMRDRGVPFEIQPKLVYEKQKSMDPMQPTTSIGALSLTHQNQRR